METPKNLLGNPPIKPQLKNNNGKAPEQPKIEKSFSTMAKIFIFLAVIIAGALVLWLILGSKKGSTTGDNNVNSADSVVETDKSGETIDSNISNVKTEPVLVSGSNAIEAGNQLAGNSALINMITLSTPGWVAIHEDKQGILGNVLGAGRFDPGIHLGEIQLLRGTVSGGTYHAVLYQDDGDKMFDMSKDALIKNAEGKIIESIFKAE